MGLRADEAKDNIRKLDELVERYKERTGPVAHSDGDVRVYKDLLREIEKFAVESNQDLRASHRVTELLGNGERFTGGDYFVLWLIRPSAGTGMDRTIVNALIRKVATSERAGFNAADRELICGLAADAVSKTVEWEQPLVENKGIDWEEWKKFTAWWDENRHLLIQRPKDGKLVLREALKDNPAQK
jgi:hypothetical protein